MRASKHQKERNNLQQLHVDRPLFSARKTIEIRRTNVTFLYHEIDFSSRPEKFAEILSNGRNSAKTTTYPLDIGSQTVQRETPGSIIYLFMCLYIYSWLI